MKKHIIRITAIIFCINILSMNPLYVLSKSELNLYATYCSVIDSKTGRVLYEKNGDEQVPMASTTKILTCILILEYGNRKDYAQTSQYAASMPKVHMGAKYEEYYLVEDLLYALMLESYNDAAVILAEYLCGDKYVFAELMNEKALEIGCEKFNFITANGLDDRNDQGCHSISATDLAKIMAYCTTLSPQKEEFIKITRTGSHTVYAYEKKGEEYVKNGRQKGCVNRNALLSMPEIICGKTGFTNDAGYCYVGQMEVNGRQISFSVLACGWPNNRSYKWSDSKKIIKYVKENFSERVVSYPKIEKNDFPFIYGEKKIIGKSGKKYLLIDRECDGNTFFLCNDDEIKYILEIDKIVTAPVCEGQIVGELQVYINEELVDVVMIYSTREIQENTYQNACKEVFAYFIQKLINIDFF